MDFDHAADAAQRPEGGLAQTEEKTPDLAVRNVGEPLSEKAHSPTDVKEGLLAEKQTNPMDDLASFDPFGRGSTEPDVDVAPAAPTDSFPITAQQQSDNLLDLSAGAQGDDGLKTEERGQVDVKNSEPAYDLDAPDVLPDLPSPPQPVDSFVYGSADEGKSFSAVHDADSTFQQPEANPAQPSSTSLGFDSAGADISSANPVMSSPLNSPPPEDDLLGAPITPTAATEPRDQPAGAGGAESADLHHQPTSTTPSLNDTPAVGGDAREPTPPPTFPQSDSPIPVEPAARSEDSSGSQPSWDPVPSAAQPAAPFINPDPFQEFVPPAEGRPLGDQPPPRIPSPSSMDAEPPTPVDRSAISSIKEAERAQPPVDPERVVEKLPLEALRNRDVQEALASVIPPAPDKPLPPTPSSRPRPTAGCLAHLPVMEILLWRDPKKSGAAFATGLVLLFSMLYCSFISVVAYFGLALLTVTLGFRLYKTVLGMVQKTNDGHPFQDLLSVDTTVTPEKGHELADKAVAELNCCTSSLKDLFLVKDIFESVKFGFVLYLLTYLGAWFNTMTLVIMGYVALFTLPKVYEQNKEKIDEVFGQVKDKVAEISAKVKAAIPMGKKAAEPVAEEKKEE
ncbi:reticulon-2-like isoform X2 [Amphibalanus amphitrite]|uniref:reticulon-2-like isoform X2 n=1 Tax=Amphibalanus amphitrite TaxID=1232801 RepID=UPI001C913E7B|nr:reticulon-2-like isoform X2 [Amphibalanus amphitrite]